MPASGVPFSNYSDLLAYYQFNEASGDSINVCSSTASTDCISSVDGVPSGVTYGATGIIGDAIQWDLTDDSGTFGTSVDQWNFMHNTSGLFTFNIWFRDNTGTDSGGLDAIFDNIQANSANKGVGIWRNDSGAKDGVLEIFIVAGSGTEVAKIITANDFMPADTDWHMMTIRYDYNGGTDTGANLKVRVDDGADTEVGLTGVASDLDPPLPAELGQLANLSAWGAGMAFDEATIFNRVWSEAEIEDVWNSGAGKLLVE